MELRETGNIIMFALEDIDFKNCPDWRDFLDEIKAIGGQWDKEYKSWIVSKNRRQEFVKIYRKYFYNKEQIDLF